MGLKATEMKSDAIDIVKANILIDEISKKLSSFSLIKGNLTKVSSTISETQTQIDNMKSELSERIEDLLSIVKIPEEKSDAKH